MWERPEGVRLYNRWEIRTQASILGKMSGPGGGNGLAPSWDVQGYVCTWAGS